MNARLHHFAADKREEEGGEGESRPKGRNLILGDDSRDVWIDVRASSYDANFDQRQTMRRRDERMNFPARGSSSSHGPAIIVLSNMDTSHNICAAPYPNVTSHGGDRPRSYDIETTSCTTTRCATYAPDASCNVACSAVPATICNVANGESTTTLLDDGHLAGPRHHAETTVPRSCHSGPIDVEDLAMYLDPSCKAPSTPINRAIYPKRLRYGQQQSLRIDQPLRQEEDRRYLDFCNLRPRVAPGSNDLRACNLGSGGPAAANNLACDLGDNTGNLTYRDLGFDEPRSCYLRSNASRLGEPQLYNLPLAYDARLRETGQNDDPKWPSDWFCDDCPELFDFCSEERWLRCPASDRCPLYYDPSHGTPAVLPPCLSENLHADYSGDWYYDYAEDEQLLEDYL